MEYELWEDNYLAHYGITGQKWGIRRWQNPDGTLTEAGKKHYAVSAQGNIAFERKYDKDFKKLRKLADKTDVEVQKQISEKYNSKAKKAAAASAQLGLAAFGANHVLDNRSKAHYDVAKSLYKASDTAHQYADFKRAHGQTAYNQAVDSMTFKFEQWEHEDEASRLHRMSDIVGYGLLGASGAALGYAAYAKGRAIAAKRRTTPEGHAKAVQKAHEQYERIEKTYANTPYISLFKEQIAAYKKEHPNTELSDKQIMKNLL